MKKIVEITVCDKCGKELTAPAITLKDMDFCLECSDYVVDRLRTAIYGPVDEDAENNIPTEVESVEDDVVPVECLDEADEVKPKKENKAPKIIDADKVCTPCYRGEFKKNVYCKRNYSKSINCYMW